MKLHHLRPAEGAKKERTRVGRGRAGTRGKTAGRGTKGWGAKHNPKPGFEGGQMPLQRRVPKLKGFTSPNRVEFAVVTSRRQMAADQDHQSGHDRGADKIGHPRRRRARTSFARHVATDHRDHDKAPSHPILPTPAQHATGCRQVAVET